MSKREAKPGDIWAYKDRSAVFVVTNELCLLRLHSYVHPIGQVDNKEDSQRILRDVDLEYIGTFNELGGGFWKRVLPK